MSETAIESREPFISFTDSDLMVCHLEIDLGKYSLLVNFVNISEISGIGNLFRLVRLKDPLKLKALQKGLKQLCEEGATQLFRPLNSNNLILGAVGMLQFDVVAYRLKFEYSVDCVYEAVSVATARWVYCDDFKKLEEFKKKAFDNLALDGSDNLTYLAPSRVNLNLTMERWPDIEFRTTREH